MSSACHGRTYPEAGVTATRPATSPEASPRAVGLPLCHHSTSIQLSAAAAAATCDAVRADTASALDSRALPPLNPNQPNQRSPAPVRVSTMLLGWMACSG